MNNYKYIIIGGGMTGDAAVKGIREIDSNGTIAMISREDVAPYARPPLTKGLWKNTPEEKIWKKTQDYNVTLLLKTEVENINTFTKTVTLSTGGPFTYEKLLLATGGTTIKLPFGEDDIIYYRTYDTYKTLRKLAEKKENFTVIGGGFIGSEIAAALTMNGKKVTMIFPGKYIGERIFPHELAEHVTDYYRKKGVQLVTEDSVKGITKDEDKYTVVTEKNKKYPADAIVGGIGIRPDVKLASDAGITTGNGITVDEMLQTNISGVYAAGDAANFYNPVLNERLRVEHENNAVKMGLQAGRNMAGADEPYNYLPFFYSDMFDLGYEAVGELDPKLETYEDWKEKFKEGVIYYLKDGRVRGVLLWNVWGQVEEARKLMAEAGPFKLEDLKDRLPVKKDK
jgi:3-phenylpropionate/trans-cinnamate dioxygenase ferredoxin reductase component